MITRISLVEQRMTLVAQDLEQEKKATKEYRDVMMARMDKQDRMFYTGIGILSALQFIAPYFIKGQ